MQSLRFGEKSDHFGARAGKRRRDRGFVVCKALAAKRVLLVIDGRSFGQRPKQTPAAAPHARAPPIKRGQPVHSPLSCSVILLPSRGGPFPFLRGNAGRFCANRPWRPAGAMRTLGLRLVSPDTLLSARGAHKQECTNAPQRGFDLRGAAW